MCASLIIQFQNGSIVDAEKSLELISRIYNYSEDFLNDRQKKIINDAVAIYSKLLNEINTNDLLAICEALEETKNNGNKTFVVGNGGSAGIASHFAVDLTKQGAVPCMCFNDSAL